MYSRKLRALIAYAVFSVVVNALGNYIPNAGIVTLIVGAVAAIYILAVAIEDYAEKRDAQLLKLITRYGSLVFPAGIAEAVKDVAEVVMEEQHGN